jgi:hypothetical protein
MGPTARVPGPRRHVVRAAATLLLAFAVLPTPAYAYIDPISGSVILQVLAAGFLAAGLVFRTTLSRAKDGVRRLWSRVSGK